MPALPWRRVLLCFSFRWIGVGASLSFQAVICAICHSVCSCFLDKTGLAAWLGSCTAAWQGFPVVVVVILVTVSILFLTELTSNTATTATFLPVVASVAVGMGQSPILLVVPAVMAASCAFMLPVGTPPNAIVFASGLVPLPRMAKTGLFVNLVFIVLIPLVVLTIGIRVFGVSP